MKRAIFIFTLICVCGAGGCQSAPEKHYAIQAEVISADPEKKLITVKHGDIPGLMPAMTMTYQVAEPGQIAALQPGDKISADLVVSESKGRLEKIVLVSKGDGKASGTTQRIPEKGDVVPDFALVNQDGKRIELRQYRGKVLLVTFIYTRCPFPDFCPRMSSNFGEIYKQLGSDPALANARLLSVSFDPEHDTPKVLRDYGYSVAHTHEAALFRRWQFGVPSAADLPKIADFFALTVKPEGGLITHNLSTAVIGPDGKIAKWYHGSDWQVSDLINDAANAQSGELGSSAAKN